jgi:molecular chaperone GrpE (heat shock protein)
MHDVTPVRVPKWPFFLGDAAMLGLAYFIYYESRSPLGHWEIIATALCAALGAALGVWPFLLDHHAWVKQLDAAVLGSVGEKIQNLEQLATQISRATNEWQNVQLQAEKTSAAANEITDRMTAEVRDFTQFMQKSNDGEKATLRLEVEKLRRAEMDWLQVLVHVLDHVYALRGGAVRSGKTGVIEQLTQFQNACHEVARRVGLVAFTPAPGDAFNAQRHQNAESDVTPTAAIVAEVVAVGFTLQGRLVRPAHVRVVTGSPTEASASRPAPPTAPAAASAPSQLTLDGSVPA